MTAFATIIGPYHNRRATGLSASDNPVTMLFEHDSHVFGPSSSERNQASTASPTVEKTPRNRAGVVSPLNVTDAP